ncbi:DUF2523 domain-containing protein, partial [Chromobacterium violaceum]
FCVAAASGRYCRRHAHGAVHYFQKGITMPVWLVPLLWGVVNALLYSIIARIVTSLGIGAVSFLGANLILSKVKSSILSTASGLGGDAVSILSMSGFGVAFSILLSAFAIRMTLDGVDSAGSFVTTKFSGFGGGK